jgi:hypothetical protein
VLVEKSGDEMDISAQVIGSESTKGGREPFLVRRTFDNAQTPSLDRFNNKLYVGVMNRRDFVVNGLLLAGAFSLSPAHSFGATDHVYKLAPVSMLPESLRNTPAEVRDAYRFAVLNRETLRYIPCYCGCVNDGHTSNASCYVKDNSPPEKPEFDPMSIG